ncbi:MAG: amidohydrolase [Lachnospiraceae bacterium]|nr:amidohydrolase [Lachnospiraceae bacterium]
MKIRFYHAKIMTMQTDFEISEGEVWVEHNRITYVGPGSGGVLRKQPDWDREIDVEGNLMMPGFKNAHTHSPMTFLRSYADDLPLQEWLNRQVFPMEAKLVPEDVVWLAKLAIMEYLTSGITSNFDMYFHQDQVVQASVETGFRTVLVSGLNDFVSSLEELEANYEKYQDYHERIGYRLGFHAEYTTSEKLLRGVAALAEKYHAPVFTHNSETAAEVAGCMARHGMTPTAYLDSLGMFAYGGGGYHCVHMSEEDLEIFEKRGLTAVTNPGSNMKLASGTAPVAQMLERGISMAIGTDGPASNNCLDMFREMFLVTGLAKLRERDASAVPAEQVLAMAVRGGARAMGLEDCDCLAEGKLADLIVIDLQQPNMQPLNHIARNLVYSGSKQNVQLTMVNGQILYEKGTFHIGAEPGDVYRKVNEIIGKYRA